MADQSTRYVYTFVPWPDETWKFDRAVYDLFRVLTRRCEMYLSADDFERFRSALSRNGITLRECVRRPYVESESVD